MKILKRILLAFSAAAVLTALGFVVWAETPLGPAPEALSALHSDSKVIVTTDDFLTFRPVNGQANVGFIFYPGGRVDYRSYSAPLHQIAAQGLLVVVVPVRLNLAFFDVNAGEPVFSIYPQIEHWAVGGHSLGGVAAALFAKDHLDQLDGLIFWASYPADDSLTHAELDVLSIYGTNDMAGLQKFDEANGLLPSSTQYVVIDGGNHGQFGDYGPQPGDNEATISRLEQQFQIMSATSDFLQGLTK